jgi:hypothetical protein
MWGVMTRKWEEDGRILGIRNRKREEDGRIYINS